MNNNIEILKLRLEQARSTFNEGKSLLDVDLQKTGLQNMLRCYLEMARVAESTAQLQSFQQQANIISNKLLELDKVTSLDSKTIDKVEMDRLDSIIRFSDVIGMDDVKNEIVKMVINPIKYPEYYTQFEKVIKPGGGIILTGDPGNGKTYFAKAIAGEVNANFFKSVKLGEVLSNSPGAPEKYVASLFSEARKHSVSVIFFDEFDAIASKRGDSDNAKSIDNKLVDALLQQIDGFDKTNKNVLLLIAATNRVDLLDEAITRPGRFDKVYHVSNPNKKSRISKFQMELSKIATNPMDMDMLGSLTEGFSFADLQYIIIDAAREAVSEAISMNKNPNDLTLEQAHLELAIKRLKESNNNKKGM